VADAARRTPTWSRLDTTWVWDGAQWNDVTAPGAPSPRCDSALAYNIARDRIVMFGGDDCTNLTQYNDTWEWDGAAWQEVTVGSPPPKTAGHALVYDPQRGHVVMLADEVWEWDGTSWVRLDTESRPAYRLVHRAAYDAVDREIVEFGGLGLQDLLGDTWAFQWRSSYVSSERCVSTTVDIDGDGLAGCADPDCWGRCAPFCPPGMTCDPSAPHCGDGVCLPWLEDRSICPQDCPL
jgi:hypothetical protein